LAALGHEPEGTTLSSLLTSYQRYVASGEINTRVADQAATMAAVEAAFADRPGVTLDHLDGLTVEHADWWFNLRPSNTEPLIRMNAEATDRSTMESLRDEVLGLVNA
jgi:phosphomannomutase